MKKLKFLFVILMGILLIPNVVLADESSSNDANNSEEKSKVNIYFFYGDGCPHCAEAEKFFDSIQQEYGDKFKLVSYETWKNSDNANLMQEVAKARQEDAEGVPYIIIGNQSWQGYMSSYDQEMIDKINSEYETAVDERYDIMNYVDGIEPRIEEKSYASDIVSIIIIIFVTAGITLGILYARKKAA